MKKWRLFELKRGDELHTLFHGVNRSRRMPVGVWIEARQVMVSDGSSQTQYLSGFHVFAEADGRDKYLGRFTAPRTLVAVEVEVRGLRPKPTNEDILLASHMRIPDEHKVVVLKG